MRIISLVDNVSGACPGEHGLSLWIELESGRKILFDMGQGSLFAENAERLGLDLADIDIAVVSHGHYDHCGGLAVFLERNSKAVVCLRPGAFEPHFSLKESGLRNIAPANVDASFRDRLVFSGDVEMITDDMTLFTCRSNGFPLPDGNATLFGPDGVTPDDFSHEQSLIVREGGRTFVFAGCAHRGAANILARAVEIVGGDVDFFVGGMHLMRGSDEDSIARLAGILARFGDCRFLTMHCTGEESFRMLKERLGERMDYLSCGGSVVL